MKLPPNNQRGTIVIVALLVFSLIEILLVGIIEFHGIEIIHTQDLKYHNQAIHTLRGGEQLGLAALKFEKAQGTVIPTLRLPPQTTSTGILEVEVHDLQSKVNMNAAISGNIPGIVNFMSYVLKPEQSNRVKQLLSELGVSSRKNSAKDNLSQTEQERNQQELINEFKKKFEFVQANPDPLKSNELDALESFTQGSESLKLMEMNSRYLFSITELLTESTLSAEEFKGLLPYVCVLPEGKGININTASEEVLLSLHPDMTINDAQAIIQTRNQLGAFNSVSDIKSIEILKAYNLNTDQMVIDSQYYLVTVKLRDMGQVMTLHSWVNVKSEEDYMHAHVYARSFGTL